jgi:peptidoglycan/LPS O-acetylase OafA/YrhL
MGQRDSYYDYIRAFAAVLVLLCHKGKMPGGSIGVSIFFCLSGFLITRILIRMDSTSPADIASFIFRRFMRIFPLYVTTLAAAVILAFAFHPAILPRLINGLPGLLTFTSLPTDTGYATAVAWSLHAEFWFYLCFPIILAVAYKRGLLPLVIGVSIAVSVWAKMNDGGTPDTWPIATDQWFTVLYLDQLMYGAICAILIEVKSPIVGLFASRYWFWGALFANLLIAKIAPLSHWHLEMSIAAILCAVAILHHGASNKALPNNFIAWVGRASFSLYLVHAVVLDYLPAERLPNVLDTPSFMVVTFCISYLTERFIERPFIERSKLPRMEPRLHASR